MRLPRILSVYLTREILLYGLLGFVAITTVLVSQNLWKRLGHLMAVGLAPADVLVAVRCMVPMFVTYAAPISFLFGALLAIRRFSSDSEILAMRACGVGLRALLLPTLVLAGLVSALTAHLMINVEHVARRELLALLLTVYARSSLIEPGEFGGYGGRVIYVQDRDREQLEGIMISDRTNPERPFLIFAERGRLVFDETSERIRIQLERGDLHLEPWESTDDDYRRIHFDSFDYSFDVSALLHGAAAAVRPKQMNLRELREVVDRANAGEELLGLDERNPIEYALEIQRRFALPLAPLVFGLLAVPLALSKSRGARPWGVLICAVVVFAYYSLLSFSQFLAKEQWLSAPAALWGPNVLLASGAAILLVRARSGVAP